MVPYPQILFRDDDDDPCNTTKCTAARPCFDLYDYLVTNIMMPTGGVLIDAFAGGLVLVRFGASAVFAATRFDMATG